MFYLFFKYINVYFMWHTRETGLTNCGTKSLSSNQLIKYSSTAEMVDWTGNAMQRQLNIKICDLCVYNNHICCQMAVTWFSLLTMLKNGGKPVWNKEIQEHQIRAECSHFVIINLLNVTQCNLLILTTIITVCW